MPNPVHPYAQLKAICQDYQAELVAVSKTRSPEEILALYDMGQRLFGENRAMELIEKAAKLPRDIEWHLIGHLQTNKVRAVIPYVACIQSLDSEKLWDKIEEESAKAGRVTPCLLQIKIAREESKFGWNPDELVKVLQQGKPAQTSHVALHGVMGMATLTEDRDQIRAEMRFLKHCFQLLKTEHFNTLPEFNTISMGMSGDYPIALEEGSTMVRVGSLLFGAGM